MKKWIAIAMLAGAGLSASGVVLQEWTFDEAAGTAINGLNNSGTPGDASWSQSWTGEFATDGNGNLNLVPGTQGYQGSSAFAGLAGSDTYSFEVTAGPWIAGTNMVQLQSKLGTEVEIYTIADPTAGLSFKFKADGNYQTVNVTTNLSGTTEHTARIDFNIGLGTAAYFIDDVDVTGNWLTLSGLTFDSATKMIWQKSGGFATADPATVLKISSQSLSIAGEPEGAYLFDKYVSADTVASGTNVVKTFDAVVGDVIVVVSASSNKDEPGDNSVVIGGGTAAIDPVVMGLTDPNAGCATRHWYTTVTSDGTVSVETLRNGTAYWKVGAYQVHAGAGYTAPQLLGGVQAKELNPTGSITNSYALGTNYVGVYIEALSAGGTGYWYPDNGDTTVSYGNQDKRNVGSGEFSGLASLENVWSSTNVTSQVTLVGLAFGSLPDGIVATPQELYDTWLSAFSVGAETGMLDHGDSDGLNNLTEYMWGGEPDNAAIQGNTPVQSIVNDGGTDYIEYIYYERDDAASLGLASICEYGTDLVVTNWADATGYETGRGPSAEAGFDVITNRIPTDVEAKQFIQLQIEFTP